MLAFSELDAKRTACRFENNLYYESVWPTAWASDSSLGARSRSENSADHPLRGLIGPAAELNSFIAFGSNSLSTGLFSGPFAEEHAVPGGMICDDIARAAYTSDKTQ